MTCIIGLAHKGRVYIGADSMSSDGWNKQQTKLRKVFRVGQFLIGYTSSFRMGQILQYHLEVRQQQDGESDERYMVVAFVEAVRDCLKSKGYARIDSNTETGGHFIVGYKAEVYHVNSDFQINYNANNLIAVGAGENYALGAMLALEDSIKDPQKRIRKALKIAARLSNGVCGPFYTEVL